MPQRSTQWPHQSAFQDSAVLAVLTDNERALLELIVAGPRSFLPPLVRPFIVTLARHGLATNRDGVWYATRRGIEQSGRSVH